MTQNWSFILDFLSIINASSNPLLSQKHMEPREASQGDLGSTKANIFDGANHLDRFLRIISTFPSVVAELSFTTTIWLGKPWSCYVSLRFIKTTYNGIFSHIGPMLAFINIYRSLYCPGKVLLKVCLFLVWTSPVTLLLKSQWTFFQPPGGAVENSLQPKWLRPPTFLDDDPDPDTPTLW